MSRGKIFIKLAPLKRFRTIRKRYVHFGAVKVDGNFRWFFSVISNQQLASIVNVNFI